MAPSREAEMICRRCGEDCFGTELRPCRTRLEMWISKYKSLEKNRKDASFPVHQLYTLRLLLMAMALKGCENDVQNCPPVHRTYR